MSRNRAEAGRKDGNALLFGSPMANTAVWLPGEAQLYELDAVRKRAAFVPQQPKLAGGAPTCGQAPTTWAQPGAIAAIPSGSIYTQPTIMSR